MLLMFRATSSFLSHHPARGQPLKDVANGRHQGMFRHRRRWRQTGIDDYDGGNEDDGDFRSETERLLTNNIDRIAERLQNRLAASVREATVDDEVESCPADPEVSMDGLEPLVQRLRENFDPARGGSKGHFAEQQYDVEIGARNMLSSNLKRAFETIRQTQVNGQRSSSSASTATIRSYRSLLPASLRSSADSYKSSKEKSNNT